MTLNLRHPIFNLKVRKPFTKYHKKIRSVTTLNGFFYSGNHHPHFIVTKINPLIKRCFMATNTINLKNDLGIITDSRVIIHKGKETNIFYLDNIKRVNLVKERKFITNLIFMCSSGLGILLYDIHLPMLIQFAIIFLALAALLMGVFHKFYFYNIVINLKDERSFVLETTPFQKKQTKNFYFSMLSLLQKNKTN